MGDQITNSITNAVADQAKQAAATATKGAFERLFDAYNSFIHLFPEKFQWVVSLLIILIVASFLWKLIKKNWLWILVLIIIFPGVLPILKNVFDSLTAMVVGKSLP